LSFTAGTLVASTNISMLKKVIIFSLLAISLSLDSYSQKQAIVLENLWVNNLNNYTPTEFFNSFYTVLKDKLSVQQIVEDPSSLKIRSRDVDWSNKIKEKIKGKNVSKDSAYFITISSDLRLPAVNLGKFLFKNPPRSSKLVFIVHVFDALANEVIADTIVNRGCLIKSIEEGKSSKYFYTDYASFVNDMMCHLEIIKKSLQQIVLPKRRVYMEI